MKLWEKNTVFTDKVVSSWKYGSVFNCKLHACCYKDYRPDFIAHSYNAIQRNIGKSFSACIFPCGVMALQRADSIQQPKTSDKVAHD